jgi:bifunctional UDP-N-acetylglucosamine pyrophosphorylase/glucosamine-1-phosphate N-acetyltransferase
MTDFSTIILAAGKGSRLKSDIPKPLHTIAGKSMLSYVVDACIEAGSAEIVIVIAPDDTLTPKLFPHIRTIIQPEAKGTGHAAKIGFSALTKKTKKVAILVGDHPFITADTVKNLGHSTTDVTVAAAYCNTTQPYGRVIIKDDQVEKIVEYNDATEAERAIPLINIGLIALESQHAGQLLDSIQPNNPKKEYYLTDTIHLARMAQLSCGYIQATEEEGTGANSRQELAGLEKIMQDKLRAKHMANGATLIDPETTYFSADTIIGRDVIIEPNVFFGEKVTIGNKVEIKAFSHIVDSTIGDECEIGPFARLRQANLSKRARIGNFVEVAKSDLGERATAKHLSYIGNAQLGAHVNIGAGTIFGNYDGFKKYKTIIHDHVNIGVNNSLVAPLVIEQNVITAAGSTITKDVPSGDLAIARQRQENKPGWATRFRARMQKEKDGH